MVVSGGLPSLSTFLLLSLFFLSSFKKLILLAL
uniref:Uncharacterized protein n=1 Tax=Geladintestivirus 5 TaxID=3233137 RepID=A0AAU8MHX2_9CAUD